MMATKQLSSNFTGGEQQFTPRPFFQEKMFNVVLYLLWRCWSRVLLFAAENPKAKKKHFFSQVL